MINDPIIHRYLDWKQEETERAATAIGVPEKDFKKYVQALYETLIEEAKKSLVFLQESLAQLTKLRDKYPCDLELGQIIWDNIDITNKCIQQEIMEISLYRKEIEQ